MKDQCVCDEINARNCPIHQNSLAIVREMPEVDTSVGFKDDWAPGGDPDWLRAHAELAKLHREKSATYGTKADSLANFTESSVWLNRPPEYAVLVRILDKASRALHMIDAGRADAVAEWPDLASLALCAEALRRRRGRI